MHICQLAQLWFALITMRPTQIRYGNNDTHLQVLRLTPDLHTIADFTEFPVATLKISGAYLNRHIHATTLAPCRVANVTQDIRHLKSFTTSII